MSRSWKSNPWAIKASDKLSGKSLNEVKAEMKTSLAVGKVYCLKKKKATLVGIYPNFSTFEKNGIKESFSYQELYGRLHAN